MSHVKGVVTSIRQCGGCVEVMVSGARSGAFPIDNGVAAAWLEPGGAGLIGRCVEYRDGYMRLLDEPEAPADAEVLNFTPVILPHGSSGHI